MEKAYLSTNLCLDCIVFFPFMEFGKKDIYGTHLLQNVKATVVCAFLTMSNDNTTF